MKRFARTGTSLLLSLLILMGGSGLIIGRMLCLNSGHVVLSTSEAKDCCADENGKTEFKKQCCAINNISFTQSNFEVRTPVVVKAVSVSTPVLFSTDNFSGDLHSSFLCKINSRPPPDMAGSSSLPLLCVFRI